MRRNVLTALVALAIILPLPGCAWFKKKEPEAQTADQYPVYDQPAAQPGGYTQAPAEPMYGTPGGGRTHTVGRKDTLYSIARMYYNGDHTKWREIYEANRGQISDPNQIRVGQRLVIP